ncbi:MAG TPA: DinB family protein, partial [Planctomycetota bacterium]|nr:DinB family protein [Planctomycetota bacterium]
MTDRRRWFDRRFESGTPKEVLPDLIERLRGTPARIEDRLRALPTEILRMRHFQKWSIQENAGHLLDLEPLWNSRIDDFLAGAAELHATDITNRRTDEARHNEKELGVLLGE